MAAIGEIVVAIAAFLLEMLVWSLLGFYRLCRAAFSVEKRKELKKEWSKGLSARTKIVFGAVAWIPIFAVGFGLGGPLALGIVREALSDKDEKEIVLEGVVEFTVQNPEDENTEFEVKIDRSRLMEIKDTKSLEDLYKKIDEISTITKKEKEVEQ